MKQSRNGRTALIATGILATTGIWAAQAAETNPALKGMEPLATPAIVDSAPAAEAHLRIGWGVFNGAQDWYETAVARDKTWVWSNDKACESLHLFFTDGTLLKTLWFIPTPEIPNDKFTLLLHGYKPIRFTVPNKSLISSGHYTDWHNTKGE